MTNQGRNASGRFAHRNDACLECPSKKIKFTSAGSVNFIFSRLSSVARAASVLSSSTYSVQPCTGLPRARRCSRPGPW